MTQQSWSYLNEEESVDRYQFRKNKKFNQKPWWRYLLNLGVFILIKSGNDISDNQKRLCLITTALLLCKKRLEEILIMEIQNREIKFMISIKCTFLISCWHNVHVFCRKSYCSIFFREIVIRKSGGGKFWKCVNEQRTSCWSLFCMEIGKF